MSTTPKDGNHPNLSSSQSPITVEENYETTPKLKEEIVDSSKNEEVSSIVPSANFNIPIHSLLTNAQNSHGLLRHNDYSQYRSYCTRRLSRIRHAKPVRRNLTHGSKSAGASLTSSGNKRGGGRHSFHPRLELTVEDNANEHVNYILDGLYSAERAWAHAMELRGEYEQLLSSSKKKKKNASVMGCKNKKSSPGSVRQHSLKRLKKATKYVNQLEGIVNKVCNEVTALEMKAYGSWMRGNWFCEIQDWKVCVNCYFILLHVYKIFFSD